MNESVTKAKNLLRSYFLNERESLSEREAADKSRQITDQLINSTSYREAGFIHCYVSAAKKKEVHTQILIEHALSSGKRVAVPKMLAEGKLSHYEIKSLSDLEENSFGIPEPAGGDHVPVSRFNLIVVPMVAGDQQKQRLGYGKGYYDRFLSEAKAVKNGLLFDCQLYDKALPSEKHDIPLDKLITESRIIL